MNKPKRGQLLIASTGTGKTFIAGALLARLQEMEFHEGKTWSHIPYLYVTRATVVEQTKRVFKNAFSLGINEVEVINIEVLRSQAGRLWVKERMEMVNGQEQWYWEWKNKINPCVICWDECQALKNEGSTQHQIAAAFNDLKNEYTYQFFISATPFTRVCEAKCFAVSTHKDITLICGKPSGLPEGTLLSNSTWPTYAAIIAAPSKPDEYNEAAVERLMKDLDEYVVQVKGVRPQFEAHNGVMMIGFQTEEEYKYYHGAWDRYLKEKARLESIALAEGKSVKGAGMMILVQFLKFRMAAEYCRREHIAKAMYDSVQSGHAAVCALGFKSTIIACVKILVEKYGVPRNKICLVWGGGQTGLTEKQKQKAKIQSLSKQLEGMGMTAEEMLKDMGLDDVEDRIIEELDPSLRLGPQSQDERQVEIDRFQSGQAEYCFFTFRAGGVGLSLHHSDEFTKEKCRKKESGYYVEEDIPNIPVKPREVFLSPTYSAIELVQGLGRCPRLTSLSNTTQTLLFYRGTIEEDVAEIVKKKLRCLSKVVRMRESWEDIITEGNTTEQVQKHLNAVPDDPSESGDELLGEDGEDE